MGLYEEANVSFSYRELPLLCRKTRTEILYRERFFTLTLYSAHKSFLQFFSNYFVDVTIFVAFYLAYSVCSPRPRCHAAFCRSLSQSSPTHVNLSFNPISTNAGAGTLRFDHFLQWGRIMFSLQSNCSRLFLETETTSPRRSQTGCFGSHRSPNGPHQSFEWNRLNVDLCKTPKETSLRNNF